MLLSFAMLLLLAGEPPVAEAAPVKEKLVCKRETPIGSLIPSRKICLTRSEWVQRIEDGNNEARRMAYDNMGRPSCNDSGSC